jgi:hypothetical protein
VNEREWVVREVEYPSPSTSITVVPDVTAMEDGYGGW